MRSGLKVPPRSRGYVCFGGAPPAGDWQTQNNRGPGLGPHPALQAPDPAATDSFVFMALDHHQTDSAEVPRQAPDGTRPQVIRPRQSETHPGTGKPAHRPRPGLSAMQSGSVFQAAGDPYETADGDNAGGQISGYHDHGSPSPPTRPMAPSRHRRPASASQPVSPLPGRQHPDGGITRRTQGKIHQCRGLRDMSCDRMHRAIKVPELAILCHLTRANPP